MFSRIYIIVAFLLSFQIKSALANENTRVEQIFTLIYNQEFKEAEKLLNDGQNQMDVFYKRILTLDLYWWQYSLSRSREDAKNFKNILEEFGTANKDATEERINELIRMSYEMRYELKRYNLISAIIIRSDVSRQIELLKSENINIPAEQLKLFDLYLALFNYFNNAINPFSIESKSSKLSASLLLLEKYSHEDDLIVSTIAHYFLGRILIKVDNSPEKGRIHFKVLAKRFPQNFLFRDIANGTNTKF